MDTTPSEDDDEESRSQSESQVTEINSEAISETGATDTPTEAASTLSNIISNEENTRVSPMTSTDVTRLLMFLFDASEGDSLGSSTANNNLSEWHIETSNQPNHATSTELRSTQEEVPQPPGNSRSSNLTPFWNSSNTSDSTAETLKDLFNTSNANSSITSLIASFNTNQEADARVEGLYLSELQLAVEAGRKQDDWSKVTHLLSIVFSSFDALSSSFLSNPTTQQFTDTCPTKWAKQVEGNTVEAAETGEGNSTCVATVSVPMDVDATANSLVTGGDHGSDVVAAEPTTSSTPLTFVSPVNLTDVRLAWQIIHDLPERQNVVNALMRAVRRLVVVSLHKLLVTQPINGLGDMFASDVVRNTQQRLINLFVILYECPFATDPLHFEHLLLNINRATTWLPCLLQARLCRTWAAAVRVSLNPATESVPTRPEDTNLWCLQRILLQLITLRCLTTDHCSPNEDKQLCEAAIVLRIVYYASLLAGQMDPPSVLDREVLENRKFAVEMAAISRNPRVRPTAVPLPQDPLASALQISSNDCRVPFIPPKDFVNETLNDVFKPRQDYIHYRSKDVFTELSFMRLPFLLQTSSKTVLLYFDNRMRMLDERREAYLQSLLLNNPELPFLKLCVSRDRIVEDALLGLDITCLESPGDLKKQLLVVFEEEQGVDEGGLSKEFFQLIIEKIFDPIYGMFTFNEELQTYWFNPAPLSDLDKEYCLIGILLGLAIYNDVILNVHFPSVVYRKLVGKLGTFEDLKCARPDLASGLQALVDYDGEENLEQVMDCYFVVQYDDIFGNLLSHELIPNGAAIPVTKSNREEFVELYADFLLNESVQKPFNAFRRGFHMVVDESPLGFLFRPDEIELLVCGSKDYNFKELERVTTYEDYTTESPVIKHFWTVVHSMGEDQQRQLLQFSTGSDRIPVGGMSKMKFTIARQGANTDRLPTAHTCFNILLLPEYSTLENLQRCLLLAITHSKGFGVS